MSQTSIASPDDDGDFRSMTIADYLAFYDRRGYGFSVGRGVKPAVVIIDFSVAFTRGTPNFPGGGYDRQVAETARLLQAARGRAPVYFTTIAYEPHMRDAGLWAVKIPWIKGLQLSSVEVAIDERLAVRPGEPVIVKKYPSAFFETGLDNLLTKDGVDTLIIAGCTTSMCVRATAIDAMQRGYRTQLAAEAIGDITPALHAVNLADLGSRYADVVPVDELIAYLLGFG
jgi:nicotinamidase-related amidase